MEWAENATVLPDCPGKPGLEELRWEDEVSGQVGFFLDAVVGTAIGIAGTIGNFLAIPILCSRRMSSVFNRLLVCLAVSDNLFILCCLLDTFRNRVISTQLHNILHVHIFYQLRDISSMFSAYATVVLAVERFLAVSRPVEYHIMMTATGNRPWRRVAAYMVPTLAFSVAFNLPKFFEFAIKWEPYSRLVFVDDATNETAVQNGTEITFQATELRMNDDYVFYYVNLARFIVTLVVPFISLVYLNTNIYLGIKKRRSNPVGGNANANADSEETRQAMVLFFIVALFLVCNMPKISLNVWEFIFFNGDDPDCFYLPLWIKILQNVSLLCLTLNSSTNFFIYCVFNSSFRAELLSKLGKRPKPTATRTRSTTAASGAAAVPARPSVIQTTELTTQNGGTTEGSTAKV